LSLFHGTRYELILRDGSHVERFAMSWPDWKAGKMHCIAVKYAAPEVDTEVSTP
jgi:hypothetical protein